jgi:hypothetical protein
MYRFNDPGPGLAPLEGTHVVEELLTRRCFIGGASVMVRRDAVADIQHRPEIKRVCDWLYFIESAHRGKVIYIPEVLVRYRRHNTNMTSITDIADEETAYTIVERLYPMYGRAVALGRARLELSYIVRYMLKGRARETLRLTSRLLDRVIHSPRILPFLIRTASAMFVQRIHLLRRSGRIGR